MTPDLLRAAGEVLHGPEWKLALAKDLEVDERTLRRWAGGQAPIPAGVGNDLARLVEQYRKELAGLVEQLRQAAR